MTTIGTCRLCRTPEAALQGSHILPAWAYRHIRDRRAGSVPDPVLVTNKGAFRTSRQVREPLLCAACEQRFSTAERHVEPLAYAAGHESPLVEYILAQRRQVFAGDVVAPYGYLDDSDVALIVYFAASVFWRSHVCRVNGVRSVRLGEEYGEQFRRYLLSEAPFPANALMPMAVLYTRGEPTDFFSSWLTFPTSERDPEGFHRHYFIVCGLLFELYVGRQAPQSERKVSVSMANMALLLPPSQIGLIKSMTPVVAGSPWRGRRPL